MKILALLTDAYGAAGGIAQYNRDLLEALTKNKNITNLTVMVRSGGAFHTAEKITQHQAQGSKLKYSFQSINNAKKQNPEFILCGHINLLPLAWLISKWIKKPIWLQVHGIDAWEAPSKLHKRIIKDVAVITSVSRYTRQRLLAWANIPACTVHVLPNTVSEEFKPAENRQQLREKFKFKDKKVLLTVGRIDSNEQYKGHDRAIQLMPTMLKQQPDLLYVIAGDGTDLPRLKKLVEKFKITGSVQFIGSVPFEKLKALYQAADLFVMPSTGEGFGIVFLEAMASGTPSIGLDKDGSRDPLQDGKLGIVASQQNLQTKILNALQNDVDPIELHNKVNHRFGKQAFNQQVALFSAAHLTAQAA